MLREISSKQLSEWMDFAELEPFGWRGSMLGHAMTSSVIANKFHRGKPFTPADFLPGEHRIDEGKPAVTTNIFGALKTILNPKRVKRK